MEISIIILKVCGIYFIISGLFLIFKGKTLANLLRDFFNHPAIVYLTGAILVFLSGSFLVQYNIWDGTINTLVTVLMWMVMIKGISYILAPEILKSFVSKKLLGNLNIWGVVLVLVGTYFLYIVS